MRGSDLKRREDDCGRGMSSPLRKFSKIDQFLKSERIPRPQRSRRKRVEIPSSVLEKKLCKLGNGYLKTSNSRPLGGALRRFIRRHF